MFIGAVVDGVGNVDGMHPKCAPIGTFWVLAMREDNEHTKHTPKEHVLCLREGRRQNT